MLALCFDYCKRDKVITSDYAGKHKYFTYASWILSALSALIALVPFWYIWKIIKEVLDTAPNFENAENLSYYGWMAVLFAVLSLVVYIGGLMCSHFSAFRVATNIRIKAVHHITKLPLGFADSFGSGKLRKIINECSGATETYLAHQLPDKADAIATPVGLLGLRLATRTFKSCSGSFRLYYYVGYDR